MPHLCARIAEQGCQAGCCGFVFMAGQSLDGRDSNFELVIVNQSLDAWNQRRIPAISDRFEYRNSDLGVVAKVMQGTAFRRLATEAGEKCGLKVEVTVEEQAVVLKIGVEAVGIIELN